MLRIAHRYPQPESFALMRLQIHWARCLKNVRTPPLAPPSGSQRKLSTTFFLSSPLRMKPVPFVVQNLIHQQDSKKASFSVLRSALSTKLYLSLSLLLPFSLSLSLSLPLSLSLYLSLSLFLSLSISLSFSL